MCSPNQYSIFIATYYAAINIFFEYVTFMHTCGYCDCPIV